ncbi:unnamed protein product [Onchocerca flexuosa]|uniref:Secreted protein n=1 Tax=Onchocerca flexuosa TaxID=387005 RepID=A0A183HIS3_9BILA|nr:unnamed protein product [Onchocerca flexuosa]
MDPLTLLVAFLPWKRFIIIIIIIITTTQRIGTKREVLWGREKERYDVSPISLLWLFNFLISIAEEEQDVRQKSCFPCRILLKVNYTLFGLGLTMECSYSLIIISRILNQKIYFILTCGSNFIRHYYHDYGKITIQQMIDWSFPPATRI